jgi:hypothetical protein
MGWLGITLVWLGFLLQLGGLLTALHGLRRTRLAYAPDEAGAFDWFTKPVWKSARLSWAFVMRLLGLSKPVTIVVPPSVANAAAFGTLTATGEVAENPIDPDLSVAEQLKILDQRSRNHREILNRLEREAGADRSELTATAERMTNVERELRAHMEVSVRKLAVEGIRGSARGLFITLLGTILVTLPMLIPALAQVGSTCR